MARPFVLLLTLLALLAPHPTLAESPHHGIAMHGDLALPPDFAAFPYVNPAAPKGGTIRQAVTGSFDSAATRTAPRM